MIDAAQDQAYSPTKLHHKIRSHLALIFDTKDQSNGSGVLIELQGLSFILTASHVLEGDFNISLGLPQQETRFTIRNKWVDDALDVGFIELEPQEVKFLRGEYTERYVIRAQKKTSARPRETTFALCGFPFVLRDSSDRFTHYRMIFIGTPIIHAGEWPQSIVEQISPASHFLVPYGPKHKGVFVDRQKGPIDPIDPFGLSGCGLWFFDPATENSDNPTYSLVGIQHGYYRREQCLVGSYLQPIIASIQHKYGIVIPEEDAAA
jgi:hypothetical protein